ncbi:histidine phosphatase family protein [Oceanobacillus damuensis]|uniref:histidine phosphatase family protein n=1 Tax=Oceanobacillus damuensis TaxID=937928 RepID=UPI00082F260A|nr:histidine phosphatase family protein [Oceanobacillus damuensis]
MKKIYFVRHCSALSQHKDSPLTRAGIRQAAELANFFTKEQVSFDLILSSPYLRAVESIKPYAERTGKSIKFDTRLQERILSADPVEDWMEALEKSFVDDRFALPGGESAQDVLSRSNEVLYDLYKDPSINNAIIVSHGNILSHLFHQFNKDFGFNQWKQLRNPDIYLLTYNIENDISKLQCVWHPYEL